LNKRNKTEFENRHRTGNAAETGARRKGHALQLRHPEIHVGIIQEAAKQYQNTHLRRSKCEVLSAPALKCCQHGARLSRLRTIEGREIDERRERSYGERKDEIERSEEMRKLT